jgi:hypothetical protein
MLTPEAIDFQEIIERYKGRIINNFRCPMGDEESLEPIQREAVIGWGTIPHTERTEVLLEAIKYLCFNQSKSLFNTCLLKGIRELTTMIAEAEKKAKAVQEVIKNQR